MLKSLRASILVLLLAFTAHAGEIPTPPVAPPPPNAAEEATTEGEIPCPPLVEFVLTLYTLF